MAKHVSSRTTCRILRVNTCGCGLAQQRVRGLHHGAGAGIRDGGWVVGVLRLCATVSLQPLRLGEHGLML